MLQCLAALVSCRLELMHSVSLELISCITPDSDCKASVAWHGLRQQSKRCKHAVYVCFQCTS